MASSSNQSLISIGRQLTEKANLARNGLVQLLIEVARWNAYVRKPDEEPIVIDPEGKMIECVDQLNELITLLGESEGKTKTGR